MSKQQQTVKVHSVGWSWCLLSEWTVNHYITLNAVRLQRGRCTFINEHITKQRNSNASFFFLLYYNTKNTALLSSRQYFPKRETFYNKHSPLTKDRKPVNMVPQAGHRLAFSVYHGSRVGLSFSSISHSMASLRDAATSQPSEAQQQLHHRATSAPE